MKVTRIFNNVKGKKRTKGSQAKDVMRLIKLFNPTKLPKDISATRLKELYDFVRDNELNFDEFQNVSDKIKLIPSLMGDIGYV